MKILDKSKIGLCPYSKTITLKKSTNMRRNIKILLEDLEDPRIETPSKG